MRKTGPQREVTVKAGVAKEVITPSNGVDLWGYARQGESWAEGIYDDLHVKVLVLDSHRDATLAALVVLDMGGLDGRWVTEIKQLIEKETPLFSNDIILSVTHTHAGPAPFSGRGIGTPNYQYLEILKRAILRTVRKALDNRVPVWGGTGVGNVNLSLNRRQRLFDGPVDQDPGTVDPQVRIYRLDREGSFPLAILVNYTAHSCTLRSDNRKFSADYPGIMSQYVEEKFSHCPHVFFLQGAAGNIEPRIRGNYQVTQRMGISLAEEVLRVSESIQTQPIYRVLIKQKYITLHWRELLSSEEDIYPGWRRIQNTWRRALLKQLRAGEKPPPLNVPLQVLSLNGTYWVALPGEPFVELGLMLRSRFHREKLFILGYTNDTRMGYIPPKQAYVQKGYEETQAFRYYGLDMPVAPGTGEKVVKELVKMIKQVRNHKQ